MSKREALVERECMEIVESLDGLFWKWTSPGRRGVPDRIMILPNKAPVFVEMKRYKGKLEEQQKVRRDELRQRGQLVVRIDSPQQLMALIEKMYGAK